MDRIVEPTERRRPDTWLGRAGRSAGRLALTLVIFGISALAVQYGAWELARRAEAAPAPGAAPAIPVRVRPLQPETGYDVVRTFIGQVEPRKTVALSFELAGRLAEIGADEGQRVRQGDVLATLDTALLDAERAQLMAAKSAAEAQLTFAGLSLERARELGARGFATQAGLDGAVARRDELLGRIAEIDAGLAGVEIRIGKSRISAPFDGQITARHVDAAETLGAGQPVLGMVDFRAPRVRIGVPLDIADAVLRTAQVELAGRVFPATLVALRPDVDPVTRTRTAIFSIDAEDRPVFGQTARLLVHDRVTADGVWVPLTSLKEGTRGQWTLLTVGPDRTVRAAAAEVLHAGADRVFVRGGFPDGTRIIAEGPQRVTVGQRVAIATE